MEFDKSGQKATQSTLSEFIQQLLGQKEKIQALVLLSFFVYSFISGFGQNEYYFPHLRQVLIDNGRKRYAPYGFAARNVSSQLFINSSNHLITNHTVTHPNETHKSSRWHHQYHPVGLGKQPKNHYPGH